VSRRLRQEQVGVWTEQDIRALGASTDLLTAASIFGLSRTAAYAMAGADRFPVPVLRVGRLYLVPVAPILHLLALEPTPPGPGHQASTASPPAGSPPGGG
jgi:hypothetical protein